MINSKKKGFTIVELVIVIAVVAILAAVLIPTFSNLVKKANLSADQVAVKNMNTALAVESKPEDIESAVKLLDEAGYNAFEALIPVSKGYTFYWMVSNNTIVLADEISPDTARLWDAKTNKKLDKDRFRRDLGDVIGAYEEIYNRLQNIK